MITNANRAGAYRLWTRQELDLLLRLRAAGLHRAELASRIGRSPQAVARKLQYEKARS